MEDNSAVSAYIIKNGDEEIDSGIEQFEAPRPNANYPEFKAIIIGLERAIELGIMDVAIACDSRFIVEAIRGEREMQAFRGHLSHIKMLVRELDSFSIFAVDRSVVKEAHNLARWNHDDA